MLSCTHTSETSHSSPPKVDSSEDCLFVPRRLGLQESRTSVLLSNRHTCANNSTNVDDNGNRQPNVEETKRDRMLHLSNGNLSTCLGRKHFDWDNCAHAFFLTGEA